MSEGDKLRIREDEGVYEGGKLRAAWVRAIECEACRAARRNAAPPPTSSSKHHLKECHDTAFWAQDRLSGHGRLRMEEAVRSCEIQAPG